jgi:hypothetical protein
MAQQKIRIEQLDLIGKVSDADVNIGCNDGGTPRNAIVINGDEGSVTMARQSYVRASRATTQAITAATSTIIQYNTETTDVLGEYDNATNYRFTAKDAGVYVVSANVMIQEARTFYISIFVNGTSIHSAQTTAGTSYDSCPITASVKLNAGDYVDIRLYIWGSNGTIQNDGGHSWLTITKVS